MKKILIVFIFISGLVKGQSSSIPCFSPTVGFPLGSNQPQKILTRDFNNDGKADLALMNNNINHDISVLIGLGTGSFAASVNYSLTGPQPEDITAGDFNGDGNVDLAGINNFGSLNVLLGLGNGTFSTSINCLPIIAGIPRAMTNGDFNGDGKLDLAIGCDPNYLFILLGTGTGSFSSSISNTISAPIPLSIITEDFNNDNILDLAINNQNGISVMIGTGTGSFGAVTDFTINSLLPDPYSLISGDFNGDGNLDIATANANTNNVSILTGSGLGTFTNTFNRTLGYPTPNSITKGDFNGDGIIDIAIGKQTTDTVAVLLGTGLGTFLNKYNFFVSGPWSITSADFNNDGNIDIATTNYSLNSAKVLLNKKPNLSIFSLSNNVCTGSSLTLTASGANTYTWSSGPISPTYVVSPTITTTYSVVGTSILGCTSSIYTKTITVNTLPILSVPSVTICTGSTGTLNAFGASTYTWNTGANSSSIVPNPIITTTYNVSGSSTLGCISAINTATITIGTVPSIIVNSSTLCVGSSSTLNAYGVTSYTWSTGANTNSIIVTPTINSTYTVTGNLIGCSFIGFNTTTVSVNPLPTVSVNSGTICSGSNFTITPSGVSTYTFSSGTAVVSPTINSTYSITGTSSLGCIGGQG